MVNVAGIGPGDGPCCRADNDNWDTDSDDWHYNSTAGAKHDAGFDIDHTKFHHDTKLRHHSVTGHSAQSGDPTVTGNTTHHRNNSEYSYSGHQPKWHDEFDRQHSGIGYVNN